MTTYHNKHWHWKRKIRVNKLFSLYWTIFLYSVLLMRKYFINEILCQINSAFDQMVGHPKRTFITFVILFNTKNFHKLFLFVEFFKWIALKTNLSLTFILNESHLRSKRENIFVYFLDIFSFNFTTVLHEWKNNNNDTYIENEFLLFIKYSIAVSNTFFIYSVVNALIITVYRNRK